MHALSSLFKHAVKWEIIARNPVDGVDIPKKAKTLPKHLNEDEVRVFLDAADDILCKAVMSLFIYTGVRRGELIGLNVDDVDLNYGVLKVYGKGAKERSIPINAELAEVLREYKATRKSNCDAFFVNSVGNRMCACFVQSLFTLNIAKAGLQGKGYTVHTLRHTFGTMSSRSGVALPTLQNLMGHEDITTTSKYVHSSDPLKRSAVDSLSSYLRSEGG